MNAGWHRSKPVLVLLLWLAFVAAATWRHAERTTQPPIYDAFTYFVKAHNVWAKLHAAKPFNPFDVEPTFRPPGTVLMSYPFGFDADYRGFYFRSIFLPVLLLAAAVIVAGYARDLSNRGHWLLALAAAFLCTLPTFYYFEVSPHFPVSSSWGLVDNFLAGMAALATAISLRSIGRRSLALVAATACIAGLCAWIKPSGVLVLGLVDATWCGLAMLRARSESGVERRKTVGWLVRGLAILAAFHVLAIALSLSSRYLSMANLNYGGAAIDVMKAEFQLTWDALRGMLHVGPGYALVAWIALAGVLVGRHLRRIPPGTVPWNRIMLRGLALASCLTLAFGTWFWIFASGGVYQFRYGLPFVLMAAVLAIPVIVRLSAVMRPWEVVLLGLPMVAAVLNLTALLAQADPPDEWQRWAGVNLSSTQNDEAAAQARDFASMVKRDARDVIVYSMPMKATDGVFQATMDYQRVANPPAPVVTFSRPVDWQRPTTFRVREMLAADYWLFRPQRDRRAGDEALARDSIDDYAQERAVFEAWATRLTESDGVAVVSETPTVRVLRIVDRDRLETAIGALVDGRRWRAVFKAANPKRYWTEQELAAELAASAPVLENIRFGDQIELRALTVTRTEKNTALRIWWKPLPGLRERDWIFFIHSIDDEGKIVLNNQILPDPSTKGNDVLRLYTITFANVPRASAARLAVGFYRGDTLLAADKGTRDWGGRRVLLPAP